MPSIYTRLYTDAVMWNDTQNHTHSHDHDCMLKLYESLEFPNNIIMYI